jgi:hypothetical protein
MYLSEVYPAFVSKLRVCELIDPGNKWQLKWEYDVGSPVHCIYHNMM